MLNTILTDKTLESESQEDKNENEIENQNDKTLISSKDENKNVKNKKTSTNTKKDENKIMFLEYMEDVDDKLFKKYSIGKNLTLL